MEYLDIETKIKHEVIRAGCHRFYFKAINEDILTYLITRDFPSRWVWIDESNPTFCGNYFYAYRLAKKNLFDVIFDLNY